MAIETERKWGKKTITLPSGRSVPIRVITEITFRDIVEQAQEYHFYIDNTQSADRKVHVDDVECSSDPKQGTIPVERIDTFKALDVVSRGQESNFYPDNKTGSDSKPPSFTTHLKTHTTKFLSPDDSTIWVQTEWIDEITLIDVVEQAQERHYYIVGNPQSDDESTPQDDDKDLSNNEGSGGDPIRTDWFQNIVDFNDQPHQTHLPTGGGPIISVTITGHAYSTCLYEFGINNPVYNGAGDLRNFSLPPLTQSGIAYYGASVASNPAASGVDQREDHVITQDEARNFGLLIGDPQYGYPSDATISGTSLTVNSKAFSVSGFQWLADPNNFFITLGVYATMGGLTTLLSKETSIDAATVSLAGKNYVFDSIVRTDIRKGSVPNGSEVWAIITCAFKEKI